jgi:hypothetical protein
MQQLQCHDFNDFLMLARTYGLLLLIFSIINQQSKLNQAVWDIIRHPPPPGPMLMPKDYMNDQQET